MQSRALRNGTPLALAEATLAITDDGAARGDGAFETVGVWDGRPFRLDDHVSRLNGSLRAIGLPAVEPAQLLEEAAQLLDGATGDGMLRVFVTASGTRLLVVAPPPQRSPPRVLIPQPAPWIRPLGSYGPAGAKTMSYAPNMAATRAANAAGGDEALLVALEGWVLEGPTFAVLWARDGVVHAPALDLGIVDSISRRTVLGFADEVIEGRFTVDDLAGADEVMLCSAVRPLLAVGQVGDVRFEGPTPVCDRLAAALEAARRAVS